MSELHKALEISQPSEAQVWIADNNEDLYSEEGMISEWAEGGEGEEAPAEDGGEPPAEGGEAPAEGGDAPAEGGEAPVEATEAPAEATEAPAEEAPKEIESHAEGGEVEAPAEGEVPAEGDLPVEGSEEKKEDGPSDIGKRIEADPFELWFLEKYKFPEEVKFDHIPRISDSRSVWRLGMRKLEETFAEHIANMHLDFEKKADKFQDIQEKLETNLVFLEQFYVDMQKQLNEKYASIKIERDAWEDEKEKIRSLVKLDSEVISLNIGGTTHLQTEKSVLQSVPGSTLAQMFSDMHQLKEIDGEIFLDRDGKTFETLVNYLRNDRKVFPEFSEKNHENHFYKELHFWNIDSHNRLWQENVLKKLDKSVFVPDIQNITNIHNITRDDQNKTRIVNEDDDNLKKAKEFQPTKYPVNVEDSQPSYMQGATSEDEDDEDHPGAALKAVKDKWSELGPLKLEDIVANSDEPIDQSLEFGQSRYSKFIIGQIGPDGRCQGVGKEINHIIYEGQFKNDVYHGYGRYIYSNGNYYIGNWIDGKRSGWGKLVDRNGKIYEGMWKYSKFIGNI